MLNFTHSLLVSTAFLSFMSAENSSQAGRSIGGCKGIKNTDVEEGVMVKVPPKPGALMFTLILSSVTAERYRMTSPDRGCKWGSTWTSWHTSVIKQAVKSRTSLCRIIEKAPYGQIRAWDKVKSLPHTQCEGNNDGVKPYCKQMVSMNSPLWREKPYCSSGSADNQEEAPFSMQDSTAQRRGGGQLEMVVCSWDDRACSLREERWRKRSFCRWITDGHNTELWATTESTNPLKSVLENSYCSLEADMGLHMPRPPCMMICLML